MSTDKRERQRANKQGARMAAAEADAAQKRMRTFIIGGVAVLVAIVAIVLATRGGDDTETVTATPAASTDDAAADETPAETTPVPATTTEGCPAEDGSSPRTIDFTEAQPMCIDPAQNHVAIFDTSEGEIRVDLNAADTPVTVNNFVTLARWGYYDGTTIHRSDPSIDIIQGGSPHTESASDPGPGYTIPDEPQFDINASGQMVGPYRYVPGQLVMARTGAPNSASGQYFFTTGTNAALLDGQGVYVVFGETDAAGLSVLEQIIGLHEPGGALGGAPSRTVTINSVTIEVS